MTDINSHKLKDLSRSRELWGRISTPPSNPARYGLTWPLHIKLTLNAWLGCDICQLSWRERQQIKMMPAFTLGF